MSALKATLFFHDPVFVNRNTMLGNVFPSGGPFVLDRVGLTYFGNTHFIRDTNTSRSGKPFAANTYGKIIVDSGVYSDFVNVLETGNISEQRQLFRMLDYVFLNYNAANTASTLNTYLVSNFSIYESNSLLISSNVVTATGYEDDSSSFMINTYAWVSFKLNLGTPATAVEVRVYVDNDSFKALYPESIITAVVPPLSIDELLNGSIVGLGNNKFDTAAASTNITVSVLNTPIHDTDNTGLIKKDITFFDSLGNTTIVPFKILYKGRTPSVLDMRRAIKALLLSSGIGTVTQWRARAPELFVENQFFLIPQWNNVTTRPHQIIYPNIAGLSMTNHTTRLVLAHLEAEYIFDHIELLTAVYDSMTLACVPNHENIDPGLSVLGIHPTYQNYSSSEPGFGQMEPITKSFSTGLSSVLAVAAGKAPNTIFDIRDEYNGTYVSFVTSDSIEYLVMTSESFFNLIGS